MQILELETVLCGMVLADADHLATAIAKGLRPEHFIGRFYGDLYAAASDMWRKGDPVDLAGLSLRVGRERLDEIIRIRSSAPPTQNIGPYVQAVLDKWRESELLSRLADFSKKLTGRRVLDPLDPIVDELGDLLMFAKGSSSSLRTTGITDAIEKSLASARERIEAQKAGETPGITTGFPLLDRLTYGFQPGFMYVLGARTSVGKTTLATVMAVNAARSGAKTAFVTVEMSDSDLADKMLSRLSRVNISKFLAGTIDTAEQDKIEAGAATLAQLPILFTEVNVPKIEILETEIMRLVKVEGVKLVIIDYLQLFETFMAKANAREMAKAISARMKQLAKTLQVPVLVLSQLNRQAAEEGEPDLVHIAESDQIARDSDVVMFLYRLQDQYYLSVAKNRRGMKKAIRLKDSLGFSLFEEVGEAHFANR